MADGQVRIGGYRDIKLAISSCSLEAENKESEVEEAAHVKQQGQERAVEEKTRIAVGWCQGAVLVDCEM